MILVIFAKCSLFLHLFLGSTPSTHGCGLSERAGGMFIHAGMIIQHYMVHCLSLAVHQSQRYGNCWRSHGMMLSLKHCQNRRHGRSLKMSMPTRKLSKSCQRKSASLPPATSDRLGSPLDPHPQQWYNRGIEYRMFPRWMKEVLSCHTLARYHKETSAVVFSMWGSINGAHCLVAWTILSEASLFEENLFILELDHVALWVIDWLSQSMTHSATWSSSRINKFFFK